jgi:hypothetical protein
VEEEEEVEEEEVEEEAEEVEVEIPCYFTPSIYVFLLMRETKFHIHTEIVVDVDRNIEDKCLPNNSVALALERTRGVA